LIIVVYVDDLVITGNNTNLILRLKKQLVDSFDMTDLGILHYFVGLQVLPLSDGFFISQYKYVMDLLTCFKMSYCKPCATRFEFRVKLSKTCQNPKVDATLYQKLFNNLIYLTHNQLEISFIISVVSRFMQDPREIEWKALKRNVRYLKGTTHFGIQYYRSFDLLIDFIDSDSADDNDDQKSTFSYVI
jgi:hypothetical protein